MASPQRENGFTPIAHQILERLAATPLSGGELRVLLHLFRSTYGWNRKEARISYGQWVAGTGMNRGHVIETLQRLVDRNIVIRSQNSSGPVWGPQKDHERWGGTPERTSPPKQTSPLEQTPLVRSSRPEVVRRSGPLTTKKERQINKERGAPPSALPDFLAFVDGLSGKDQVVAAFLNWWAGLSGKCVPGGRMSGYLNKKHWDGELAAKHLLQALGKADGDELNYATNIGKSDRPPAPSLEDYEDAGVVLARQLESARANE